MCIYADEFKRTKISLMTKRSKTHPKPSSYQPRVRPGFEKLDALALQLDQGSETVRLDTMKLGDEVKVFAVDALAAACRFKETDPAVISPMVQHLDDTVE